ncbi:MAG: hypothetical protein CVU61_07025 [Deltaproteobacteria bacterium HGW-Deltaproteobacteria-19]|nr:MAG: hypothetical protein CVU61_07025 [Deltaproteobacteria bacterium HGW-Deltaproteobacteria-19]
MELRTAVRERRSIRQFRREAVPRELIGEILQDACYAPSWGNTQPWEIFVVTGEALEAFRSGNRENFLNPEGCSRRTGSADAPGMAGGPEEALHGHRPGRAGGTVHPAGGQAGAS